MTRGKECGCLQPRHCEGKWLGGPRSSGPEAIQFMHVKVLSFVQAKYKVLDVTLY